MRDLRREDSPPPPPRVGDALEVEVEEEGDIEWRPAIVQRLLAGARFSVCVDDDPAFTEEYGMDDEGREWRRPAKYTGALPSANVPSPACDPLPAGPQA